MKAAILNRLNEPLVIVEDLEHLPLEAGQVLVKVMTSSICGKQIGEISGHYGPDKYLPHGLGHEGSGTVVEIGPGVTTVKLGDHVVLHWRKGSGIEAKPPKYKWGNFTVGAGPVITFNDWAVVSENRLTTIPDDIPFDIAALMGCAVTTGLGLINNEAKLKIGQSIAVFGCGGVGMNIIQGAMMISAYPIIAIDKDQWKLDMAVKFGATHTFNTKYNIGNDYLFNEINKVVKGGVDVAVDCTGDPWTIIPSAYNSTSAQGKTILVGQPHVNRSVMFHDFSNNYGGKVMFASQGGLTNPTVDIPRYCELYKTSKLQLKEMITHRFPLYKINEALDVVRRGEAIKCIIDMDY